MWRTAISQATTARQAHIRMPGTTPARNSFEIEMPPPAATLKMIMLWLGGITTPAIDEVTVTLTA